MESMIPILRKHLLILLVASVTNRVPVTLAGDWPTFRHDISRSGTTVEELDVKALGLAWTWRSPHPPQPAWPGPAKWNAFAHIRDLSSMRNYDPVFHVSVGGSSLYFGSTVDDSVHCLDTRTGKQRWQFTTDGPVRLAPTVADGKLYFGSDDGHAYCTTTSGRLLWRCNPQPGKRLLISNGKLISFWPIRTGVLVDGGTAFFAASLLPWRSSYLCAVDAATGGSEGDGRYVRELNSSNTFEGPLLATASRLIVPQGRVPPLLFERESGALQGQLDGAGGGCFVVLTPDHQILHGPGNGRGQLLASNPGNRAKIATYPQGKEMVIARDIAYLMKSRSLTAIDRKTRKTLWHVPGLRCLSIIVAGDTLFAGGFDEVTALGVKEGRELWKGKVDGKAHGLAVADGALFVSTDEGCVHCFRPGAATSRRIAAAPDPATRPVAPNREPPAPVREFRDPDLLGRWVFHASEMKDRSGKPPESELLRGVTVNDLAGKLPGTIVGDGRLVRAGRLQALNLDGATNSVLLAADHKLVRLPKRDITVEAWISVEQPLQWGGILGAMQDNGSFERGWILGYNGDKFSFGVNAKGGRDAITYLPAKTAFVRNRWHHVVGTYNGSVLKIYVDGKLENTARDQQGDLHYPPRAFVEIAAYHDRDEYFRLAGQVHEVRLYQRALSETEVTGHFQKRRAEFPGQEKEAEHLQLAWGPSLRFTGGKSAVVRFETREPSPTIFQYTLDGQTWQITDETPKTMHEVRWSGLKANRTYTYVIKATLEPGAANASRVYECDTSFDYSPSSPADWVSPYSRDARAALYEETAEHILKQTGIDRGICLVLGCAHGRLAFELARRSRLKVIGIDTDRAAVAAARAALHRARVYGARVSVMHARSLTRVPLPGEFANLIVSETLLSSGTLECTAAEVHRLLRPGGGVAYLGEPAAGARADLAAARLKSWLAADGLDTELQKQGGWVWAEVTRGEISGAGEWTHQYGRADNSAYGGEKLSGVSNAADFEAQWVGRPGPRYQPDRNGRKPSPLSTGGRLFAQGLHRVVAIDAFNGTILWSVEIPDMIRMNIPRDSGNWCADDNHVYIAIRDHCWQLDAADGNLSKKYPVIDGPKKKWRYDWGFVASHGDLLLGSAVKQGTAYTDFWGGEGWYDAPHGPQTFKVSSETLFAKDKESGTTRWAYADGLCINSTITVGGQRVVFVECRHPNVVASPERRIGATELWQQQFMVALDVGSGRKLWERALDTHDGTTIFSLASADEKLVLVSSGGGVFHVYTFDAARGDPLWDKRFGWPGGKHDHGKAMSRPAIASGTLFVRPLAFDLATGEVLPQAVPGGGCGTYACAAGSVIFRAGNITMWDVRTGKTSSWSRLRPGCWLSTIPAAGMLLSPEAGGGCSCGNWLETSIAFKPVATIP